jgi:hypothetical protein
MCAEEFVHPPVSTTDQQRTRITYRVPFSDQQTGATISWKYTDLQID